MYIMILNKFNFKLLIALFCVHSMAIIITPMLLIITANYLCLILLLPSLCLTNTSWALIHEAIHNNLNSNPKKNLFYGRLLAVLLHGNFETLKFGHLQHHRYNRSDYDLTEGYNSETQYKFLKILEYYLHISVGLYLFEVLGPLLLLLPVKLLLPIVEKIVGADHAYVINGKLLLLKSKRLKNIRIDNVINIILFGLIMFLYSGYLWMYFSYLFIRALLISSTDNLPHYGANLDNIEGAFNLKTPAVWQKMILNFNFHKVHHKNPNLPWNALPSKFIAEQGSFDQLYFKTYFKQWLGIIDKKILNRSKS